MLPYDLRRNCDDLAAIILPWYTMDLKSLEAFLPGPREAAERVFVLLLVPNEVVPLTLSSVSDVCMSEANASFDTSSTLVDSNETSSFFISSHKCHTIWERCRCFFPLNQLHESTQSNTNAWQCVAYFPIMIFYIYCILSYMVYYVALSLCGYKCPKVYKQRILKHPVQQNANITATLYCPTSFYIHYMYYIYIQ